MQALTHCGNRAALVIWGPSDGEAYLEMLTESALAGCDGREEEIPQRSLTPLLLLCLLCPRFLSFALNEGAMLFLSQMHPVTAIHPLCQPSQSSQMMISRVPFHWLLSILLYLLTWPDVQQVCVRPQRLYTVTLPTFGQSHESVSGTTVNQKCLLLTLLSCWKKATVLFTQAQQRQIQWFGNTL